MALTKFTLALKEKFPELDQEVADWISEYSDREQKEWHDNKADGKLTFGKYKGYSLDELAKADKGKEYLQWLLAQSFFSEEKFSGYHKKLKELNIKKKPVKKQPLE